MKEDWLRDIHDQMADFETEAPAGLWEGIEAKLVEREARRKRKAVVGLWAKWASGMAAAVAVGLTVGRLTLVQPGVAPVPLPAGGGNAASATTAGVPSAGPADTEAAPPSSVPGGSRSARAATLPAPTDGLLAAAEAADESRAGGTPATTQATAPEPAADTPRERPADGGTKKPARLPANGDDRRTARASATAGGRLSLGAFTAGGAGASLLNRHESGFVAGVGPDAAEWEDSPMLGILLYNQGQDVEARAKHRQPIRAGLTLAYRVTDRLSVESGLTYTRLSSDIREGSESHYVAGEQTLNYVGVPLSAKYRLAQLKKLDVYASAGVLVEQCVTGNTKRDYVVNREKKLAEREDIGPKPLQVSANAAVGVQYNLTPLVGVYAEPGASYYFDDRSSLQTIYKEKPLNLNINLGVRLTIGN